MCDSQNGIGSAHSLLQVLLPPLHEAEGAYLLTVHHSVTLSLGHIHALCASPSDTFLFELLVNIRKARLIDG